MNKNRKIKRGVTAGIAAGMSFLLGALPVCAADTSVSKDETVYVNADATGSQKQVTVSNWLKNAGLEDTVADESIKALNPLSLSCLQNFRRSKSN